MIICKTCKEELKPTYAAGLYYCENCKENKLVFTYKSGGSSSITPNDSSLKVTIEA